MSPWQVKEMPVSTEVDIDYGADTVQPHESHNAMHDKLVCAYLFFS